MPAAEFEELMLKTQAGDEDAEIILSNKAGKLCRVIVQRRWKFVPPGYAFDDIVQEGMAGVAAAIKTYDSRKNMTAYSWLRLHICNKLKSLSKYLKRDCRNSEQNNLSLDDGHFDNGNENPLLQRIAAPVDVTEEVVEQITGEELISRFAERLSPLELRVLQMRYDGFAPKDIRRITGLPPKTIDNTQERIKKKFRKMQKEAENEAG